MPESWVKSARDEVHAKYSELHKEAISLAPEKKPAKESDNERDRRESSEATVSNTMENIRRHNKGEDYYSLGIANEAAAKNKLRSVYNINSDDDLDKVWEGIKADHEKRQSEKPKASESVSANRMNKDLSGNFWSRPEDFEDDIKSRGWDVEEMNGEYAVISNNKGSQWEVRFDDHADDGDLTVKNFKPLMIDEEDDKEELSDAAPCRKLTGDTKIKVRK